MSRGVVVVGAGLVGSALARRLAESGLAPLCLGPDGGPPYSSHDDSGRITRVLDTSPTWATLAARAIAEYPSIESRSAVRFHHPVGVLWSARAPQPLADLDPVRSMLEVETERALGGWDDIVALGADDVLLERGSAGYVTPREMLRAHRSLAKRAGATFEVRVVEGIDPRNGRWAIRMRDGGTLVADRVVVTAGAGSRELVGVDLSVTGEVVIDAALPDETAGRLAGLPCVGRLTENAIVEGYFTPPIHGKQGWTVKFGAELAEAPVLDTEAEVSAWMRGEAHRERLPAMAAALRGLLPAVDFGEIRSRPCIYTRTPSGLPIVDEIEPGLVVVTGGNGRMAKSADAVAALAVSLVVDGSWADAELDVGLFGGRPVRR